MSNRVIIDLEGLVANQSYNKCLKMCEEMGLIETSQHGDKEFGRITQKGVNVLCTILQMGFNAEDPDNRLKLS